MDVQPPSVKKPRHRAALLRWNPQEEPAAAVFLHAGRRSGCFRALYPAGWKRAASTSLERSLNVSLVPMVIEQTGRGERSFDIYSRLLNDRIVMPLRGGQYDRVAGRRSTAVSGGAGIRIRISLYINSPRRFGHGGMAIYDTMNYIKCDVSTICIGMAASMGAFLLSSGAKGKRYALPQRGDYDPSALCGYAGPDHGYGDPSQAVGDHQKRMNKILSENTGKPDRGS